MAMLAKSFGRALFGRRTDSISRWLHTPTLSETMHEQGLWMTKEIGIVSPTVKGAVMYTAQLAVDLYCSPQANTFDNKYEDIVDEFEQSVQMIRGSDKEKKDAIRQAFVRIMKEKFLQKMLLDNPNQIKNIDYADAILNQIAAYSYTRTFEVDVGRFVTAPVWCNLEELCLMGPKLYHYFRNYRTFIGTTHWEQKYRKMNYSGGLGGFRFVDEHKNICCQNFSALRPIHENNFADGKSEDKVRLAINEMITDRDLDGSDLLSYIRLWRNNEVHPNEKWLHNKSEPKDKSDHVDRYCLQYYLVKLFGPSLNNIHEFMYEYMKEEHKYRLYSSGNISKYNNSARLLYSVNTETTFVHYVHMLPEATSTVHEGMPSDSNTSQLVDQNAYALSRLSPGSSASPPLHSISGGPNEVYTVYEKIATRKDYFLKKVDGSEVKFDAESQISFEGHEGQFKVDVLPSNDQYVKLLKSIFDFQLIEKLLSSPKFTFCYEALQGVAGAYAIRIFVEELGAKESSLLSSVPRFSVTPSDSVAIIAANAVQAIPYFSCGLTGVARNMHMSAALDVVAKNQNFKLFEVPAGWKLDGVLDANECNIHGDEGFGTVPGREKDGIWAVLAWLSVLAYKNKDRLSGDSKLVTIEDIVRQHWATYGRHYYTRYDYENVDAGAAKELMANLVKQQSSLGEVNKELKKIRPDVSDIMAIEKVQYKFYEDGLLSKHQGIRILFEDGSRLVFHLSGTGSEGGTICICIEQYEKDPSKIGREPQDALASLVEVALKLFRIQELTDRSSPTAVT